MAQTLPLPPPGFDDLPLEDQLDYVQSLWDHIAAGADELPLKEWQGKLLDERLADFRADPEAGDPADEVLGRLLERYPSAP